MNKSAEPSVELLSPREIEVLRLIAQGFKREEIAERLCISKLTYDGYRKNIRNKMSIKSQADWMRVLYQMSNQS